MIRRNPVMTAIAILAALAICDLLLLVSDYRILVHEERGEEWSQGGFLEEKIGYTLSCTYFTGRSLRTAKMDASDWKPDECPFILRPRR